VCTEICLFDALPPGDALISLFGGDTSSQNRMHILPDTIGEIDLRPPFQIISVADSERKMPNMSLTTDEQKSLTGSVVEYGRVSGLIVLSYK
jgi:hypothetical protein